VRSILGELETRSSACSFIISPPMTLVPGSWADLFVHDQAGRRERAIVDWGYNAWGNKYPRSISTTPFPSTSRRIGSCRCSSGNRDGGRLD